MCEKIDHVINDKSIYIAVCKGHVYSLKSKWSPCGTDPSIVNIHLRCIACTERQSTPIPTYVTSVTGHFEIHLRKHMKRVFRIMKLYIIIEIKLKNIVAKSENFHHRQFLHWSQSFQKSSAVDIRQCVCIKIKECFYHDVDRLCFYDPTGAISFQIKSTGMTEIRGKNTIAMAQKNRHYGVFVNTDDSFQATQKLTKNYTICYLDKQNVES